MSQPTKCNRRTRRPRTGPVVLAFCALFSLAGCNGGDTTVPHVDKTVPGPRIVLPLAGQAQSAHEKLGIATAELHRQVDALLENPGKDSLQAARHAWRTAHAAYKATRLYQNLELEHPQFDQSSTQFDQNSMEPVLHRLWDRLDAYPLEPGYLDYVTGYPFSGLVFAESIPLTQENLNEQHHLGDAQYVTLGFHALEFLLWGENQDQETRRSWQDYARVNEDAQASERSQSQLRRRQFLETVSDMLTQDLQALVAAWQSPGHFYPTAWSQAPQAQRDQRLHSAIERTLQQEVAQPLQRLLSLENKDWDPALVESAFSHNGKADLQAALAPVTEIFEMPDLATRLALDEAQREQLIALHQQLLTAINNLRESAFAPTGARLSSDDTVALRETYQFASAQLALLKRK